MGNLLLLLIFGLLLLAVVIRIPPLTARSDRELSTSEIGFLRAGARGALVTAVTALDVDGVVAPNRPKSKVKRTGAEPLSDADELEQAVFADLTTPARLRALVRKRRTRAELTTLRDRLRDEGLIPGEWRRRVVKAIAVVLLPVAVLVRLVTDPLNVWIVVLLAAALVAGLYLLVKPKRTVAGWRVLNALRQETERLLEEWRGEPDYWWEKEPQQSVAAHAVREAGAGAEVPLPEGDESEAKESEDGPPEGFFNTPRSRFKRLVAMAMTGSITVSTGNTPYGSMDYDEKWGDEGGPGWGGWHVGDGWDGGWDIGDGGGGDGGGGGGCGGGGGGCGGGG
ncbi:TIGR04222 domain-containing membrane protein [Nocardia sp. NPDC127526]|uniref:TIGR04222 domain-containing membrane protein n=1 Tax=Nocardia sp. NPDC127526 TaxID=3345393 RepID=UPI003644CD66